jgi:hypothetical protein
VGVSWLIAVGTREAHVPWLSRPHWAGACAPAVGQSRRTRETPSTELRSDLWRVPANASRSGSVNPSFSNHGGLAGVVEYDRLCEGSNASEPTHASLVGTWRIVRHSPPAGADTDASLSFGTRPRGYLVYDATGHGCRMLRQQIPCGRDGVTRQIPFSGSLFMAFRPIFGTYRVDSVASW